jgi:hypothetical protein
MVNAKFVPPRPGRPTVEQGQTDFEELKRLIHGKLVDKLDLTRLGDLEGNTLRREKSPRCSWTMNGQTTTSPRRLRALNIDWRRTIRAI